MKNMRVAIIYSTKYGTTAKFCAALSSCLDGRAVVETFNLRDGCPEDIGRYDAVVLATSVYAGKPRSEMAKYCASNGEALCSSRLFLFVCGMDLEHKEQDKEAAFPSLLRSHTEETTFVEGEFLLHRMNVAERLLLRVFFKVKQSLSRDYASMARDIALRIAP